ncbi:MAG TPA: erythromycin esterase family protein [Usitatibacter sp.]|nr:erythromycin esterase family protein [Usitatibacter sp.]
MIFARAVAAVAALSFACAQAALLDSANLGFESWSDEGHPDHWGVGAGTFHVRRDCDMAHEGRCSARFDAIATATREFASLGQGVAPGAAAGHRLKLSGWIRTRDVSDGYAGLWLRVDGRRGSVLGLENMHEGGARGTTDWRRFEASVPVVPNAARVVFGVLMTGSGTAWFDDLSLEVDESVDVPPYPEIEPQPRPVPSQALSDDASLRIPAAQLAEVKPEWREEAVKRAHPIRSLFSDDFSDLAFLAPLLDGKRLVQLGESGHGVAEFNWMKVRLVKYLHERLGFDVLAFESSLSGCDVADSRIGSEPAQEVMRDCLFAVWGTSEVEPLFEYLEAQRKTGHPLELAGFDTQNSGRAKGAVSERLVRFAAMLDAPLAAAILEDEGNLRAPMAAKDSERMGKAYAELAQRLSKRRDDLLARGANGAQLDITIQEALSRIRYVEQLARTAEDGYPVRDEGMADNLDFLLDRRFPGRKMIAWAHNFHVAKEPRASEDAKTMGTFVAKRRGAEVYTVGLYMGRGVATENDRKPYDIAPPPAQSLEAILAGAGWKMSFTDLSRQPVPSWARETLMSRDWGKYPAKIVPSRAYDGVIYIDTVTPPDYLQ